MAKKKLGKILIIPKGDYDAAVLYRRLDLVKYNGTSYLCKKDNTIGIEPTNIERWYKVVDAVGDMDIFFEEVSKRENISSSDPLSLILGKIKKWFDDLKPVAFSGKYKDLVDTPQNATISVAGLMSEKDKKKLDDITESADSVSYSASLTNGTKVGTIRINGEDYELYAPTNTDTKNTAGAKDSTQKLYLIGATSQANAPQTYSQDTAYVGTDGCIYSNNKKTITIGEVSRSAAITVQGNYALDAIEKNASIEGTLAYLISSQNTVFANQLSQLNSNMAGKLTNGGYYRAETSINDMTAPGIHRFYVNPNTDNANYLGWTGRTLLICTSTCAGYIHQIFYSDWGHCVYRRNVTQDILSFDYNLPLRHIDAKSEVAELSSRITALENLINSNG